MSPSTSLLCLTFFCGGIFFSGLLLAVTGD